jgi:ketosteroid isomerase-like protein
MRSMRIIAPALVAVWNPPASAKESKQTSGHGMTAVEQTDKGNVEQQIKTLQEQLVQATFESDTSLLEKFLAEDYTAIHSDGKLSTKAQEIENFKSGALKYESIDVHERKIRAYGDTAIVNSQASVKARINGKPVSGDFRSTRVWVKQKSNWKIVAFQATRIPASK